MLLQSIGTNSLMRKCSVVYDGYFNNLYQTAKYIICFRKMVILLTKHDRDVELQKTYCKDFFLLICAIHISKYKLNSKDKQFVSTSLWYLHIPSCFMHLQKLQVQVKYLLSCQSQQTKRLKNILIGQLSHWPMTASDCGLYDSVQMSRPLQWLVWMAEYGHYSR